MSHIKIEFFHDVLSAWCYPLSPRLRQLVAKNPDIEVIHRTYYLADDPLLFQKLFPNPEDGKKEIVLVHWQEAKETEKDNRINPELMMSRPFPYPYSMPALRACKAAEFQGGQAAHWDYFDRVQKAHLTECQNVADIEVLRQCAKDIGLDLSRFDKEFNNIKSEKAVRDDYQRAKSYGIMRIPALVANERYQLLGIPKSTFGASISEEHLTIWINDLRRELSRLTKN